jgi:hypothetical protein
MFVAVMQPIRTHFCGKASNIFRRTTTKSKCVGNRTDEPRGVVLNLGGGECLRFGSFCMAIYRLIAKGTFGPDEIKAMTAAYEAALLDLGLVDRDDPITEIVAKAIVGVTDRGERDPAVIKERALNAIGARKFGGDAAETPTWDAQV